MKKEDIEIGCEYIIKHTSGAIRVKVLSAFETGGHYGKRMSRWECLNLKTGRTIVVKSAAKFQERR